MIAILPGMGATQAMYQGPWRSLAGAHFVDWPQEPVPVDLPDLARRVRDRLPERPRVVIGSSLGGMVAAELAELVDAELVVLIGSARSGREVRPLLRHLAPLAAITPLGLLGVLAGSGPGLLSAMYAEHDPAFIRAMIRAIPDWHWTGDCPVYRIHGRGDPLINCEHADLWLEGGHLLAMTHADVCVDAIERWLVGRGVAGSRTDAGA